MIARLAIGYYPGGVEEVSFIVFWSIKPKPQGAGAFRFYCQISYTDRRRAKSHCDLGLFRSLKKGCVALKGRNFAIILFCHERLCSFLPCHRRGGTHYRLYIEGKSVTPLCVVSGQPSGYCVACVEDSILLTSDPDLEQLIFEKFPRFETLCRILPEQLFAKKQKAFADFKNASPGRHYLNLLESSPDLVRRVPPEPAG